MTIILLHLYIHTSAQFESYKNTKNLIFNYTEYLILYN